MKLGKVEKKILEALAAGYHTNKEIAWYIWGDNPQESNCTYRVTGSVRRLRKKGLVVRVRYGEYYLVEDAKVDNTIQELIEEKEGQIKRLEMEVERLKKLDRESKETVRVNPELSDRKTRKFNINGEIFTFVYNKGSREWFVYRGDEKVEWKIFSRGVGDGAIIFLELTGCSL